MTNDEFRMWIKGYTQLTSEQYLNYKQFHIIKSHANLVLAIANHLDDDIIIFLEKLEMELKINNQISVLFFRRNANNILKNVFV